MLTGKHLKIWEYEWPRFATKDTSAPHGWRGYDIDLIAAVGQKLNFTYEIHELSQQSGETWGNMLQRSVEQGDLVLSYWARTPERIATFSMLAGHIDYSPVLTTMTQPVTEVSFSDRVESTFRPFSYDAWLVLTLIIIASGFIDYLLERETGGSISSSIYEYVGGTLWGGWQDPRSTLSAYYQVMLSFIILIIISSYTCAVAATDATAAAVRAFCAARPCVDRTLRDETRAVLACRSANLAAFLTVRAAPSLSVKSISDLMDRGAPVCIPFVPTTRPLTSTRRSCRSSCNTTRSRSETSSPACSRASASPPSSRASTVRGPPCGMRPPSPLPHAPRTAPAT
jgi:hypothetical protein